MEGWLAVLLIVLALLALAALIVACIALSESNKSKNNDDVLLGTVPLVPPEDEKSLSQPHAALVPNLFPITPVAMTFLTPSATVEYTTHRVSQGGGSEVQVDITCSQLQCIPVPMALTSKTLTFLIQMPMTAFPGYTSNSIPFTTTFIGDSQNATTGQVGWPVGPYPLFEINSGDPTLMDITIGYEFSAFLPSEVVFNNQFAIGFHYSY